MINDEYTYPITQVNCLINSLEEDVRNKIPTNVVNFFNTNADMSLINDSFESKSLMFESFTDDTLKFLKVIDYYING